jgi:hypothetical protein
MRIKTMWMALVLSFLSCLSIGVLALDPGTIAVPSITGANMDMPKPLITPPTMDMPNASSKVTVVEGKKDPLADGSPFNETEAGDADRVSGEWRVRFAGRSDVSLGLNLWASGIDKVMGFGSLVEGAANNSFSASGSILGDNLVLSARSAAPKFEGQRYDQCDLDLILANDTLSGIYILRWQGEEKDRGNATAMRA